MRTQWQVGMSAEGTVKTVKTEISTECVRKLEI